MSKYEDKFTEAYQQYYSLIYSTLYTKVENIEDVNDICQDIFIKLYHKIEQVDNYKSWLYGTMKYTLFEYYRKNKDNRCDIEDFADDVALTYVNGFNDQRMIISEALDNIKSDLDDQDFMIFEMIAIFNYKYSEAAKHLGLSRSKVVYKYQIIVKRIIDYLKKRGIQSIEELL